MHQVLALLGHLNYAIRIIPQAKSFFSQLLTKAASIPSLHDHVVLDDTCKMEMRMWQQFLSSWNGISFFYDNFIIKSPQCFAHNLLEMKGFFNETCPSGAWQDFDRYVIYLD